MAKILIVDDDRGLLLLVREYLTAHGYEVEPAHSATQARNYLKNSAYDAIISDFNMPGESGLDLLNHVSSFFPELPFILMTGHHSSRLKREVIAMGGSGYIEKPFQLKDLVKILTVVLGLSNSFSKSHSKECSM